MIRTLFAAALLAVTPLCLAQTDAAVSEPAREELRHILLGSPDAIEQTIHLLYRLNYTEPGLWSPITAVGNQLIITAAQGEAISLLRRTM